VIPSRTIKSRVIGRLATAMVLASGCMTLAVGCGVATTQQDTIPAEFVEKLDKEHPELFVKKVDRNKTEVLGGRDKRRVIQQEWMKARQGTP
jgi:hypothetical protein